MRQHEDEVGLLVRREACGRGASRCRIDVGQRRQACDRDVAGLVDDHEKERPDRQMSGLAETRTTPVEARTPAIARAHEHGDEDERLQGDAQGGADAQDRDLLGGEHSVGCGRGARDGDEEDERRDRDDVVEDGREHRSAKPSAGVEHLAEQRVYAVEEDLREAKPREGSGECSLGVVVRRCRVEVDEDRREEHRGDREDEEHEASERDESVGVGLTAVSIVFHAAHELGDEDRVECAADDEDVEDVGHRVAQGVRIGDEVEAERRGERNIPRHAGDTRDDRACRHDRARPQETGRCRSRLRGVGRLQRGIDFRFRRALRSGYVARIRALAAHVEAPWRRSPRCRARRTMS